MIAAGGGNVIVPGALNRTARAAQAQDTAWMVAAPGTVLSVPAAGAVVTATDCEILFGAGQFTSCRHGDVRDAERSNVVQLDRRHDVWTLDRAE